MASFVSGLIAVIFSLLTFLHQTNSVYIGTQIKLPQATSTITPNPDGASASLRPGNAPTRLPQQVAPQTTASTELYESSSSSTGSHPVASLLPLNRPDVFGCYYRSGNFVAINLDRTQVDLQGADAQTFVDISPYASCFGKDENHVYQGDNVLPWADPATFSVLWYQRGPIIFFRNGTEIVAWAPKSTAYSGPTPSSTPMTDDNGPGNFYVVPGGDPSTFQIFFTGYDIAPWAKDKNNVYCEGAIIQGADPSMATIVDLGPDTGGYLSAMVKGVRHTYEGCLVISPSDSDADT